jgi:hypothetical protein
MPQSLPHRSSPRVIPEVAHKPAGRDPRMPSRILPRDQQRQLERLGEAESADLLAVAPARAGSLLAKVVRARCGVSNPVRVTRSQDLQAKREFRPQV